MVGCLLEHMIDQPLDSGSESPDATAEVLGKLLENKQVIAAAELEKIRLVVGWIVVNEVDPCSLEQGPLGDRAWLTAGAGSPYVTEFEVMEFAAVLGMDTTSGRAYLCRVAELRYRLPRLWEQIEAGILPVWRALKVAEDTWTLPEAGAEFVDRHLASVAASCTWAQIHRLVQEATARFDPEKAEEQRRREADTRRFDIGLGCVEIDGVVQIDARLDLGDALDLEAAIASVAHRLLELGCEESLDVRRSIAAGEIPGSGGTGVGR